MSKSRNDNHNNKKSFGEEEANNFFEELKDLVNNEPQTPVPGDNTASRDSDKELDELLAQLSEEQNDENELSENESTQIIENISESDTFEALSAYAKTMDFYDGPDEDINPSKKSEAIPDPEIAKKERAATQIVGEILKTERTFLEDITTKYRPLFDSLANSKSIPSEQKSNIKNYVAQADRVFDSSQDFIHLLESKEINAQTDTTAFSKHLKNVVQIGLMSKELLDSEKKNGNDTALRKSMLKGLKSLNISTINDPFIYAIQRLPRYELLCRKLQSKVEPTSDRGIALANLGQIIAQHGQYMNAAVGVLELIQNNKKAFGNNANPLREKMLESAPDMAVFASVLANDILPVINRSKGNNDMLLQSLEEKIATVKSSPSSERSSRLSDTESSEGSLDAVVAPEAKNRTAPPRPTKASTPEPSARPAPPQSAPTAPAPATNKNFLSAKERFRNPALPPLGRVREHLNAAIQEEKKSNPDLRQIAYHLAKVSGYLHKADQINRKQHSNNKCVHNIQTQGTRDLITTINARAKRLQDNLNAKIQANPSVMRKTSMSMKERFMNPAGPSLSEASFHLRSAIAESKKKSPNMRSVSHHLAKANEHIKLAEAKNIAQFNKKGVHTVQTIGTRDLLDALKSKSTEVNAKLQSKTEEAPTPPPNRRKY